MDCMGADFDHVIGTIRKRLGAHPVPLQFPLGREDNFIGVIDFLEEKVIVWLEETLGAKYETFPVEKLWDKSFVDSRPDVAAALKGSAIDKKFYDEHRNKVVEYVAEHDDEVIDKYLNEGTLSLEEMRKSIRKSTLALKIVPVLAGSAFKNKGIQPLLDAVVDYLPSPVDVPPVEGTNPVNDETELRLPREDPTFRVSTEPDTGQTLISGMGELHLEIIVDRMLREYNVQANVGRPQVAYRETIRKKATAEGKYIKQTGGRGQYGHCKIELHPIPSSSHESMKEMSTDDLDALGKQVVGGPAGKWKVDKEQRFLFIDKVIARIISL